MYNYCVMVRFNGDYYHIGTNDYMMAWKLYREMCEFFPNGSIIDIVDATTGEVFQCNTDE